MTREVPVGAKTAVIDDEDYELVTTYTWRLTVNNRTGKTYIRKSTRELVGIPSTTES
jgi:hypothetical protein